MPKTDTETQKLNIQTSDPLTSVEEYTFEPIKGYPMLNWKGKRPFRSTQYFPAQLKENHGEPVKEWMNEIYWGDNLQVMSHLLKKYRGQVQLIYIDPPFDSKAEYKKKISLKGKTVENDHSAFEEKQYSDIWTNDEYLQFMYERLILMKELLHDEGTLVLHCDATKGHNIRCILDEIFGINNFLNEVIWDYRRWPTPAMEFQKMHDNLYYYVKNKGKHLFNRQYMPRTEATEKRWKGKAIVASHSENGERIPSDYGGEDSKGSPLNDVWFISIVAPSGHERENYPTQKPIALLERIINASSNPGDLIFDCFMGSGTTQAVAMKLGRRFIGADINLGAIQITTKRLINISKELKEKQESAQETLLSDENEEDKIDTYYTGFSVYNVNNYDIFRNPVQAKELLIEALEIQPLPANTIYDGEKDGRMVKIMPVNRIATRADLNDLITNFDYKTFEKRDSQNPGKPVESLLLVCMGHEPDLKAVLQNEVKYKLDIEIVDILRDRSELQFKRDSEAEVKIVKGNLEIKKFYPMNLLKKLSLESTKVDDWRELVESVMIDWNFDGAVFEPKVVDVPGKNDLVQGKYKVPDDAGTIKVKITDLLSESWEGEVDV